MLEIGTTEGETGRAQRKTVRNCQLSVSSLWKSPTLGKSIDPTRKSNWTLSRKSCCRIKEMMGRRRHPGNREHSWIIAIRYSVGWTQIQSIRVSITGGWAKRQNLLNLQHPVDQLEIKAALPQLIQYFTWFTLLGRQRWKVHCNFAVRKTCGLKKAIWGLKKFGSAGRPKKCLPQFPELHQRAF